MEQFAPVKRSKDGQPVRYLIVDDSVFARKNLARMIETFGGQVAAEAGDGLTAISEFDRTHPDIVLMDITMPQMEGIEAAERIVQQHPEARIVMVSSVGYQENTAAWRRCTTARGAATGRSSFRAEAGEAGSAVRGHQVCVGRRWYRSQRSRSGSLTQ